ncbi:uncharacterized protein LOC123695565 [Colias croceus]|uniref:uncharacterized protein LOC123695565 n=1 Tax=Colias crocea TaxID=72248 RepID=UPI001E27ABCE|nr:uncharacterized protein LOC123695565 [Colias croceus]XP_045497409.1 uncharacterized protein LOC123695565 [Colias croceus]
MHKLPQDIVDCVVGIMDDGPEPMKNFKPVQKIKNGLEKFWASHQAQYEARGRSSGSRVNRVHRHNAAYPKLIDELDRRRSMTKITALKKKDIKFRRDPTSNGCAKFKRNKYRRRGRAKSKAKSKSRTHRVSSRTKISKPHSKGNNRNRFASHFVTTGCQCAYVLVKDKKLGTDYAGIFNMESKLNVNMSKVITDAKAAKAPSSNASKTQAKSVNSSKYPDTSVASMSTYHSYATLDQEPMV